jgi:hypothetical protein
MSESYLQGEFLQVFAEGHRATAERIVSKLESLDISPGLQQQVSKIVHDEIRGLYHGNLVVFDGGSNLANHGMIKIIDDNGAPFVTYLHEIGLRHYDEPE